MTVASHTAKACHSPKRFTCHRTDYPHREQFSRPSDRSHKDRKSKANQNDGRAAWRAATHNLVHRRVDQPGRNQGSDQFRRRVRNDDEDLRHAATL
jgi:hypothetical protein